MLAVVDANELFSLLIRGTSESEEIFVSNKLQLIAPEFMLIEFLNNKEEILSKTHRTEEEFSRLLSIFERRIKFIAQEEFNEFVPKALKLFPEHPKDMPYLALALKFNCPVWSEEKLLKKQSEAEVFNTKELFKKLGLQSSFSSAA